MARILVSEIERSTVTPLGDAQATVAALTTLAETTARLEGIASDCGIDPPPSLQAWTAIFDLLDDVSITLQKFYGDVFEQPLDETGAFPLPGMRGYPEKRVTQLEAQGIKVLETHEV